MLQKLFSFFVLIKFEHTIFALPFAYIGGIVAYKSIMPFHYWFFITLACVFARTFAMLLNRIIDLKIDRENPRTRNRPLITGEIRLVEVIPILILSVSLFFFSCYKLNFTCLYLSPIALFLISSYPYTKRFTYLSHLYLGLCLSCAPIGGSLAISERLDVLSLILGLFVVLWVSGFDIIYSFLDVSFDKEKGLYSLPAIFGLKRAKEISLFLHILASLCLIPFGVLSSFGIRYWIGVCFIFLLLMRQHIIIKDISKINEAFFTTNGLISILFFFIVFFEYFKLY